MTMKAERLWKDVFKRKNDNNYFTDQITNRMLGRITDTLGHTNGQAYLLITLTIWGELHQNGEVHKRELGRSELGVRERDSAGWKLAGGLQSSQPRLE